MMANRAYGSLDTSLVNKNNNINPYSNESTSNRVNTKEFNVDDILVQLGDFSRFQLMLNGLFCLMMMPSCYQVLIVYFLAIPPTWRCAVNSSMCVVNGSLSSNNMDRCVLPRAEWFYEEREENAFVTSFNLDCENEWIALLMSSIFFIGWGVGAIFLGFIAGKYGRKYVLFPSYAVMLLVGLGNAFVSNIWLFMCCRFVIGFATPGIGLQMFIMISEYVGYKHRALASNLMYVSGSVSFCLLGLMAYFIRQWNLLLIVSTAPYLLLLGCYRFVPESIRWLYIHGKTEEINTVVEKISKWNKRKTCSRIPSISSPSQRISLDNPFTLCRSARWSIKTLVLCYLWLITCMIYYGLSFSADDLGGSIYRDFTLVSIMEIPAVIIAILLMDRVGRKKTTVASMLVGGIACLSVACVSPLGTIRALRIAFGMTGKFCLTISVRTVFLWSVEIYPTIIRAEAMGLFQVASRIGAAGAPWIVKGFSTYDARAPFLIMGLTSLLGAAFALFLKETKGKELLEIDVNDLLNVSSERVSLKN